VIIEKIAVIIIFALHQIQSLKSAIKNNKFQNIKLKNNILLFLINSLLYEINKAHKLIIKLYQSSVYGSV